MACALKAAVLAGGCLVGAGGSAAGRLQHGSRRPLTPQQLAELREKSNASAEAQKEFLEDFVAAWTNVMNWISSTGRHWRRSGQTSLDPAAVTASSSTSFPAHPGSV